MTDEPTSTSMQNTSGKAAITLQAIVEEERAKRIKAEQFAQSIVEEFTSCNDFEEVRKKFREKIKEVAPQALINIVNMANYGESEAVRAGLNKWILDWAMSDKIDGGASDLNNLLKDLRRQPASESTNA